MKLPKFLFCENPIINERHDGRSFIFHTQEPKILAEIFHFENTPEEESIAMQCKSAFEIYGALEYEDEYIVIAAIWIETINVKENETQQKAENRLAGIMRRMADWYHAYLKWEDSQIDFY